ncbi:hypothetical protein F5X97DRAFT_344707 [Nemania serpens]|nr:hypothetical protein F5X97DRAFT_344707 [Nemania serpens]
MNSIDLDHTPVRPPPPRKTSNFTNPESGSYQLIILISILSFFAVLITSLRLDSRLRVTKSFGADDTFGICATVLTLLTMPSYSRYCTAPEAARWYSSMGRLPQTLSHILKRSVPYALPHSGDLIRHSTEI